MTGLSPHSCGAQLKFFFNFFCHMHRNTLFNVTLNWKKDQLNSFFVLFKIENKSSIFYDFFLLNDKGKAGEEKW